MASPAPRRPQNGAPLYAACPPGFYPYGAPQLGRGVPLYNAGAPLYNSGAPLYNGGAPLFNCNAPLNGNGGVPLYMGHPPPNPRANPPAVPVVPEQKWRPYEASVHVAMCSETGDVIAIKFFNYNQLTKMRMAHLLRAEMQGLSTIKHPNIVFYKGGNAVGRDGWYATFSEYCVDGDLHRLIVRKGFLPVDEAITYLYQILVAIQYLHQKNISHRDIKSDNFFLQGKVVKCGDFGLADWNLRGGMVWGGTGTYGFMAPEIFEACRTGSGYGGMPADIYAVGCLTYEMLAGRVPFRPYSQTEDPTGARHIREVTAGNFRMPDVDVELQALLRGLLCVDPSRRMTANEALMSPVFYRSKGTGELPQALSRPGLQITRHTRPAAGSSKDDSPSPASSATESPGSSSAKHSPAKKIPHRPLISFPSVPPPVPQKITKNRQHQQLPLVRDVTPP
ncbi:hypothetical protein IAT38_002495 [Cryptococcus sp. DSM 104549]